MFQNSNTAKSIFLVAAKRTPFGSFGGSLKHFTPTELGAHATIAALTSANIDPALIQNVFFGNVVSSSPDAPYLARHVALKSHIPQSTPCLTINRLCGSGFETLIQGVQSILLCNHNFNINNNNPLDQVVVCGGTENMSMAPMNLDGNLARWGGVPLGKGLKLYDSLWSGLTDAYIQTPMATTAENLATQYEITREECDSYAILSQSRWKKGKEEGWFDLEIAPMEVHTKKGTKIIDSDEHPRPESTLEKISKLNPVFQKDGVVTAANASGIADGAGTIILASEEAILQHNLKPLARVVSYDVVGCDPTIMGIGPVPAIQNAISKANLTLSDMDRIEINEAFAAQYLACEKALGLDRSKTNVHGGAISLGHPLAASGSRILAHLAQEFQKKEEKDMKYCVGAACIGGGQGIAVVLERA